MDGCAPCAQGWAASRCVRRPTYHGCTRPSLPRTVRLSVHRWQLAASSSYPSITKAVPTTDQVRDRAAGAVPRRHRDRLGRGLGGRELLRLRGAHEAERGRGVVGAEDGDGLRLTRGVRARLVVVVVTVRYMTIVVELPFSVFIIHVVLPLYKVIYRTPYRLP